MADKGPLLRAEGKLMALASVDSRLKKCADEQQLTLLNAIRELIIADIPPREIMPLVDMYAHLVKPTERRKLRVRYELAVLSAAVTVLKKNKPVDAAIAAVATPNGISRKDLKNFRDRLNRGLADGASVLVYKTALSRFEEMTGADIMALLDGRPIRV
jgi:hypothetical protein